MTFKRVSIFLAGLILAVIISVPAWAAEIVPASEQVWQTYINPRFGYSVAVPQTRLVAQPAPENGDGQSWKSEDGKVEITVFGNHWSVDAASFGDYRDVLRGYMIAKGARITFDREGVDWFVFSGYQPDGHMFYRKVVALPGCDIGAHMHLIYPEMLKDTMDGIVARMAKSLGPAVAAC